MPELPEVETVRRGLAPYLVGAQLVRVVARRPDLRFPLPEGFVQRLTGARVSGLGRRGKHILAELDRDLTLVMHLGMTGRFEVDAGAKQATPGAFARASTVDPKHAHVVFETDRGTRLTYYDARRFGYMELVETSRLNNHPRFAAMGPEPLGERFSAGYLASAFAGRRQGVKVLLLDQSIVAGLGNIYVCEALHRSRISPYRPAGEIGRRKLHALASAVQGVLEAAIAAGGSTLRDYASVEGETGYFQHDFEAYGREGEGCTNARCGGRVRRAVQAGRSTFYCPACQR